MLLKKPVIVIIVLAAIFTITALVFINQRYPAITVDVFQIAHQPSPGFQPPPPTVLTAPAVLGRGPVAGNPKPSPIPVPPTDTINPKSSLLLPVPFTSQAPRANWDTIHNEDCEEASSLMANAYYNGPHDVKLDPSYVEGQLTKLTDWEMQNFGYNLDVTSEETVKMIEANYGLQTKILSGFTESDIKNELGQNHLVLIPANGRLLGNPNYRQPGPKYHMLVIRGYTATTIITNDPGTHNGLNYAYSFDILYKANGEWSHQTNSVDLSKKNVIVVWK